VPDRSRHPPAALCDAADHPHLPPHDRAGTRGGGSRAAARRAAGIAPVLAALVLLASPGPPPPDRLRVTGTEGAAAWRVLDELGGTADAAGTAGARGEADEPADGATDEAGSSGSAGASVEGDDTRAAYIAAQLRRDPVYISPSLTRVTPAATVAALRRRVKAMPYPTYVAFVPGFTDDPEVESLGQLIPLLRDRVGRDGLYLVADGTGYGLDAEAIGVRTKGDAGRVSIVSDDGSPRRAGPLARVDIALRHLATGYVPSYSVDAERAAREWRPVIVMGIAAALGFLVPVVLVLAGPRARERRRALREERLRAAAGAASLIDEPDRDEARGQALDAVAGLARAIAEDRAPADRALRAYEAASHVLATREPRAVDLVGAATLAQLGRAWLRDPAWRPCFFDPRHGRGDGATRWRRGGQEIQIPTCGVCAKALRRDREPRALGDDGRPYYERDTVWARTGFGALDDDVAEIVLAGPGPRS
jgi:hypothetical protein